MSLPKATSLQCPSCGAPIDLRLPGKSERAVCNYCGTLADVGSDELKIVDKYERKAKIKPLIELGSRGVFEGQPFELVGFMRKKDDDGGRWDEYLLFNPYLGYRYLSYWKGHWNYINMLPGYVRGPGKYPLIPGASAPRCYHNGERYRFYYRYTAEVEYVIGEFNWQVEVGEKTIVSEYIRPPYILSGEAAEDMSEAIWSFGEYQSPEQIQSAFNLEKKLPAPYLVASSQPNPHKPKLKLAKRIILALSILLLGSGAYVNEQAENRILYSKNLVAKELKAKKTGNLTTGSEFQFEIGDIEIPESNNLQFQIKTDLSNEWMYLVFFLMDENQKTAYTFDEEMSYYWGYTDGESWSEGSNSGEFSTVNLKPGKYYLMIAGETNIKPAGKKPVVMGLTITRGVTSLWIPVFFTILLWGYVVLYWLKVKSFEAKR